MVAANTSLKMVVILKKSTLEYTQWRQTEWKLTSATRLFDHEKRDFRDF